MPRATKTPAAFALNVPGFDRELHRQMKIRAAEMGTTLREAYETATRAYLEAPHVATALARPAEGAARSQP